MSANTHEMSQGPAELFEKVVEVAASVAKGLFKRHMSSAAFQKLIDIAFRVSFVQVEGHFQRFCMFATAQASMPSGNVVAAVAPFPLSFETLRQVGPAVPPQPLALFVDATGDELVCHGIGRFARESPKDIHPSAIQSRATGIVVSIDGPGSITVDGILWQVHLRHGKVELTQAFRSARSFIKWSEDVADTVIRELHPHHGKGIKMPCARIRNGWNSIMEAMAATRHGGAIAILPVDMPFDAEIPDRVQELFQFAFRSIDLDLGRQAYELVTPSRRPTKAQRLASGNRFVDSVQVVAQLANVDGCVVFDRRLRLAGFGWVIRGNELAASAVTNVTRVNLSAEPVGEETLGHLGTRHRSAARLCLALPGTHVFAVSQDGPIRHFFSGLDAQVSVAGPFHVVRDFPP
jgi:hypothetical protein